MAQKVKHKPETRCSNCGHEFRWHGSDCHVYLGKGKPGADRKGFCACANFQLAGRKQ